MKQLYTCALIFSILICSIASQAQAPATTLPAKAPFKTATKAQQEDSLYNANHPKQVTEDPVRRYDTSSWGGWIMGGLDVVLPSGDFGTITSNGVGYGFTLGGMVNLAERRNPFRWERKPYSIYTGLLMHYLRQGGVKELVPPKDTISKLEINSTITNTILNLQGLVRFEAFPGPVKLFVDGNFGVAWVKPEHRTELDQANKNAEVKTGTEWQTVSAYGYGIGLRTGNELLKLEFKWSWMRAGTVSYIDVSTLEFSGATPTYRSKQVNITYSQPQVLITYMF